EKIGLSSGLSTSPSIDIRPSLRTLLRISNSRVINSMYSAFEYLEPFSTEGSDFSVALIALPLLPTKNAPVAAPPIINNSTGWNRECKCPPASANPPNTEARTTTYPIMTNKRRLPVLMSMSYKLPLLPQQLPIRNHEG